MSFWFVLVTTALLLGTSLPSAASQAKRLGLANTHPVWSPDASHIAFESKSGRNHGPEVWVMDVHGSGRHDLGAGGGVPTWSRDGKRVAFTTGPSGAPRTVVVRRDGTGRHLFAGEGEPDWSSRNEIAYDGVGGIHVVRPDGTHDHLVAADGTSPHWSPDGTQLAFLLGGNIWGVDRAGGSLRQLTSLAPYEARSLAWAPDGKTIAFIVGFKVVYPNPPSQPFELWTIDPDTGHSHRIVHYTPGSSAIRDVTWSPGSTLIAFGATLHHRRDIFEIRKEGGATKAITRSALPEWDLDWGKTQRITFSGNGGDIYTITANGRNLRDLTRRK